MNHKHLKRAAIILCCGVLCASTFTACKKNPSGPVQTGDETITSDSTKLHEQYTKLDYNPLDYVTLGQYKGLEAYQVISEVSDDDVAMEMDNILIEYTEYAPVTNRGIKDGDSIVINYTATVDGETMEDFGEEDASFVQGDGYMYEEIEAAILGKKSGESAVATMTFPSDYFDEAYANKTAEVKIDITSVEEVSYVPTWTDEFVSEISDTSKTVAEYKEELKSELLADAEAQNYEQMQYDLWNEVLSTSSADGYPDELFDLYYEEAKAEAEASASEWGLSIDEYLEYFVGETLDEYAVDTLQSSLIEEAIAADANIILSDNEYYDRMEALLPDLGYGTVKDAEDAYSQEQLYKYARELKIMDYLVANATITQISADEYNEMFYGNELESSDIEEEIIDEDDFEDAEGVNLDE